MKTLILILTSLCFFNIKNYSRDISIFDNFWTENLLVNNNQNIPLYFNSNQVNDKFIKDTIVSKFISYDEVNFCAVGIGTGSSYGSIGVKFQKRHGRNIGFGYHFGFGYLLDSKYH